MKEPDFPTLWNGWPALDGGRRPTKKDGSKILKRKILFVCNHNSARSQMAEALMNKTCAKVFEAHSAGMEPGTLNPLVVEAMQEIGMDISGHKTKSVTDILKSGMTFVRVITVCNETSAERCPVFPGSPARLHWSFPDPSAFEGTREEKLEKIRTVRDAINVKIEQWCSVVCCLEGAFLRPVGAPKNFVSFTAFMV